MNQDKRQHDVNKQPNAGKPQDPNNRQNQGNPNQGGKTPQSDERSGSQRPEQGGQQDRPGSAPKPGGQQR